MPTPKIIFKYSSIYDQHFKEWLAFQKGNLKIYPSPKSIINYIDKIQSIWEKNDKKILFELADATKLKWDSKFIYCYIVGNCVPFSDPLTLKPYKEKNCFVDTLIHELIHQLFAQTNNIKKYKKIIQYYKEKYNNESQKTIIHILVHAIHSHIYLEFYSRERLNKNIEFSNQFVDYRKAWDIVLSEGYNKILQKIQNI